MKTGRVLRQGHRFANWVLLIGMGIPVLLVITLLLFLLGASFMDEEELRQLWENGLSKLHFLPSYFSLQSWKTILFRSPEYLLHFWNSVKISLPAVLGATIVSSAVGYGLTQIRFRGKRMCILLMVLLMLMPYQVTLTPNFLVMEYLGLLDSPLAIILPSIFHPLGMVAATYFMLSVPKETLDAARVDGAGPWQSYFYIALGQAKGGLAILALYLFLDSWNVVEPVFALLRDRAGYPLSVALNGFSEMQPGIRTACCILYILPALLIFGAVRELLLEGLIKEERNDR